MMSPHLVGFYIHGSISTLDYTAFSDLDTVLILKDQCTTDPSRLKSFIFANVLSLRFLYEFQMLHHHGTTILTEQDLLYYNQALLPKEVFEHSTLFWGSNYLEFYCRDSRAEHFKAMHRLLDSLNHYLRTDRLYRRNVWHFRNFIGTILMCPVLFLELLGEYVYKKYSFLKARKYFARGWYLIDMAEQVRRRWLYHPSVREILIKKIFLNVRNNPMVFEYCMRRMSQEVPKDMLELIDETRLMTELPLFVAEVAAVLEGLKGAISASEKHS